MSGLIFKDFFLCKKYLLFCLIPFLLLPEMLLASAANGSSQESMTKSVMIAEMLIMLFAYMAMPATITSDERKAWAGFIISTPLAARGQVASKYYICLIILLAAFFAGYLFDIAAAAVMDIDFTGLSLLCTMFFVLLLMLAAEIPFSIRFGSANGGKYRATILMLILFAGMVYFLFGDISIFSDMEKLAKTVMDILDGKSIPDWMLIVSGLFPYFSVIMYYLSYRLSCRSYTKGIETFEK